MQSLMLITNTYDLFAALAYLAKIGFKPIEPARLPPQFVRHVKVNDWWLEQGQRSITFYTGPTFSPWAIICEVNEFPKVAPWVVDELIAKAMAEHVAAILPTR